MSKTCPSCGSSLVSQDVYREISFDIPYGPPAKWTEVYNICESCCFDGDFDGHNDKVAQKAIEEANYQAGLNMLKHLKDLGYSYVDLERLLSLGFGTISKWESQGFSREGIALLRVIRTYPWIIKIAENNWNLSCIPANTKEAILKMALNTNGEIP